MLLSLVDMDRLVGFGPGQPLFWTSMASEVLGIPPAERRGPENLWTEQQFQELCARLAERLLAARQKSIDDEL